jgi:hypothetical protein
MVLRPARILVVDDEPGMLRAVERVLSKTIRSSRPGYRATRWRSPTSFVPS